MAVSNLVVVISERRQQLDQRFYDDLRKLRKQHGDAAVDRALAEVERQREMVAAAPAKRGRVIGNAKYS
ncbi:MAG: hypothetical protein WB037_18645 [Pseudolabrys sp.]